MEPFNEPFADPETSKEEIYRATYSVLKEHGFAGVSIQRIADRTSLSKSSVFHHFDDKETLLTSFSEELLTMYLEQLVVVTDENPVETLHELFDLIYLGHSADGVAFEDVFLPGYIATVIEMRGQAVRNAEMQAHITRTDELIREEIAAFLAAGVEDGSVRDIDVDAAANFLFALIEAGVIFRTSNGETAWMTSVRRWIDLFLDDIAVDEHET